MSDSAEPPIASLGSVVSTACQGLMRFEAGTPHAIYRGQRVYFCLPDCLKLFQNNPKTSCLAGNPLLVQED